MASPDDLVPLKGVGVKTADTDLFLDASTGVITLAKKDHSRLYATLVSYADNDTKTANLSAQGGTKARTYNQATFCNGSFTGAVMRTETSINRARRYRDDAILEMAGSVTPSPNAAINANLSWTLRYDVTVPVAPPVQ